MLTVEINLSDNKLSGLFPRWETTNGDLPVAVLTLDGNAELSGCVLAYGSTKLSYQGTKMTGRCLVDQNIQERAQGQAMRSAGAGLFCKGLSAAYDTMLDSMFNQTDYLGSVIDEGQSGKVLYGAATIVNNWGATISVQVDLIDGVEYITSFIVTSGGLNLTNLPILAKQLPRLKSFTCQQCFYSTTVSTKPARPADLMLPPSLAVAAPRLETLSITNSALVGKLPTEYGEWQSLKVLDVRFNYLTGKGSGWY